MSSCQQDALKQMTTRNYRHLPIVDDSGYVSGIMDVAQLLQVQATVSRCCHCSALAPTAAHQIPSSVLLSTTPTPFQCIAGVKPRQLPPAEVAGARAGAGASAASVVVATTSCTPSPLSMHGSDESATRPEALAGLLTNRRLSLMNKGKEVSAEYQNFFGVRTPTHVDLNEAHLAVRLRCVCAGAAVVA